VGYIRRVVTTLRQTGPLCDDCLSTATRITPRQRVAAVAQDLVRAGRLVRKKSTCPECGRPKRISGIAKPRPEEKKKGFFAWLFSGAADDKT
jgi:hypothetical protein